MTLDHSLRILELFISSGCAFFLWKGVRSLSRFTVHLEEYPLHRHVGREHYLSAENIIYPKGQAPDEEGKHIGVRV